MSVTTIDPSTGKTLATYEETTADELNGLLDRAHSAAQGWRDTPPTERAAGLRRLAMALREGEERLAWLATQEMGKPLLESRAEVEKCARTCEWYAEHAPALLKPETVQTEALRSLVVPVPLGVLLAIMPWNFPYWQVVRALAPALAAGNVMVLKHVPSTTGCALALAEVADAAGLPTSTLSVLVVSPDRTADVSAAVVGDDRVGAVTLTGSTWAGRSVAAVAGQALKKTVLELGGSDAFVVLADADLDAAAASGSAQSISEHRPVLHRSQAHRGGGKGSRRVHREATRVRARSAPGQPNRRGCDGGASCPRGSARRARAPGP